MKIVVSVIVLVLLMLAIFTAANWEILTTSTILSFVAIDIEGPLGIILLGVTLTLTLLVVVYALLLRTSWLVESRRLNRQLEEQRKLALEAETSRFVTLKELIEREFKETKLSMENLREKETSHLDKVEQAISKTIEENTNSIMANIGYLDDKLKG